MKVRAENGLVRILKAEGVEWVSTFPSTPINNACGEEGVPNLMMRTERFAVAVADGFSRVSNGRRIGVCSVQGGMNAAGIQEAYGGLAQAYEDSSPVLCVTAGVEPEALGTGRYDISNAFRSVTKWTGYINKPHRVPEFMRRAFTYLRTGRPGPVLIQIPPGLGEYDESEFPYVPVKGWKHKGDPRDVEVAVRALLAARRPIIYAGQGVFHADACDELLEFAELVQTPVLTTLKAKSAFPEDHPLSLGVRGVPAEMFLRGSDLIFAVGSSLSPGRFSHHIPGASGKVIVQCTIDEMDINRNYRVDHAVVGDAKLVLGQLTAEAKERAGSVKREGLLEEIREAKKEHEEKYMPLLTSDERPINPYRVYWELMHTIDRRNSFVTHDSGNTRDQLSTVYEALIPHGFMGWGNVSTLGFGLGAAMGAKLAFPDRQVVNVTGDAGVGYQLGNYEALVRNEIGITTIHINNSAFGGYGPGFWGRGRLPYTSQVTPSSILNMAKAVEAMGEYAERVEDP
ncbi:MAG: thiamine pyrophosphate-dependent enzyme, partial [Candidatus Bathyarchaeia archaeon]